MPCMRACGCGRPCAGPGALGQPDSACGAMQGPCMLTGGWQGPSVCRCWQASNTEIPTSDSEPEHCTTGSLDSCL